MEELEIPSVLLTKDDVLQLIGEAKYVLFGRQWRTFWMQNSKK